MPCKPPTTLVLSHQLLSSSSFSFYSFLTSVGVHYLTFSNPTTQLPMWKNSIGREDGRVPSCANFSPRAQFVRSLDPTIKDWRGSATINDHCCIAGPLALPTINKKGGFAKETTNFRPDDVVACGELQPPTQGDPPAQGFRGSVIMVLQVSHHDPTSPATCHTCYHCHRVPATVAVYVTLLPRQLTRGLHVMLTSPYGKTPNFFPILPELQIFKNAQFRNYSRGCH